MKLFLTLIFVSALYGCGGKTTVSTNSVNVSGTLNKNSQVALPIENATSFREISDSADFSTALPIVDEQGNSHLLKLAFWKTQENTWEAQVFINSDDIGGTPGVPSRLGDPVILKFSTDTGELTNPDSGTFILNIQFKYLESPSPITVDLSQMIESEISEVDSISSK